MLYFTIIGAAFIAWLILVTLFTPAIPYHIESPVDPRSDRFIHILESACQTTLENGNCVEIFTNGPAFYPAMLDAIGGARETINMECYIFKNGEVADRFVQALSDRARAGVRVTMVMDAIGSLGAFGNTAAVLREAGCRVEPYQQMHWYRLARLNNRTHRELLIVDGRVAFVGGAGVADWWSVSGKRGAAWRDMMARIEGPVVSDIQGIFAENWLECCGEIMTSDKTYKPHAPAGRSPAFAIKSSPADRATASRVLFQTLVECAREQVVIATPYFLPDRAFRRALRRTAERGVAITVIVPGRHTDQRWVRLASRRMYGELLRCGLRLFEFDPGMTHQKTLLVDGLWAVIGTTNLDNRSFEHNDEVNVAIRDERITARLVTDLTADIERSREITLKLWNRRPLWEKVIGRAAWILERQQ
jgi:cardiolipin synthase A/B